MADQAIFLQRYNQLNDAQKQAVDTTDGPVLVIAGPGSGKTELLSLRVAAILRQDVLPSSILCLTFTDAACTNMRQRLASLIGPAAYRVSIQTFHSFGTDIIHRFPEYFYHGAVFQPADDLMQIELLDQILRELPYDDPLASKHEEAFTYVQDIKRSIADLKKAGLTADQFGQILDANERFLSAVETEVAEVFDAKVTVQMADAASQLLTHWVSLAEDLHQGLGLGQQSSLAAMLAESLATAVQDVAVTGKTAAMTAWKKAHIAKDESGKSVLRERRYTEKMRSLQRIYGHYRDRMHAAKYFDFDDMLLDVLQALATQAPLRYQLQEQYQYILVDEFQDTNDAQMRLLGLLTEAEVNEGRPNIMVVGDDDQAIYKFQGANLANIQQFRRRYIEPTIVVLDKNYRSTQSILDVARHVMDRQSSGQPLGPGQVKRLEAAGKTVVGEIRYKVYATKAHELERVAEQIAAQIKAGVAPEEITVIARWHKDLQEMCGYLERQGVAVKYERQRNALDQEHIRQLLNIGQFIQLLSRHAQAEADELLPEILGYPFWGIDKHQLWELSVAAGQATEPKERLWLYQMEKAGGKLAAMAEWFHRLRGQADVESVEKMLEYLMGAHLPVLATDDDGDEDGEILPEILGNPDQPVKLDGFVSPFKQYYFDNRKTPEQRGAYLSFLSALQAFIQALRAYKPGQTLKLADMLQFVQVRQANNLPVTDRTPYASGRHAVELLTAHKAKGLEYGYVYLILCQDGVWKRRGQADKLPFPANLPISSEADDEDDMLRIFYVALTRAKHHLYLTGHKQEEDGKESLALEFLTGIDRELLPMSEVQMEDAVAVLEAVSESYDRLPLSCEEQALLLSLVDRYVLSVTHLNDFLDLRRAGPQKFLEDHILRFPQPQSLSQAYGTAVHRAVQELFYEYRFSGALPDVDFLLEHFDQALESQRLARQDHANLLDRGHEELETYYISQSSNFSVDDVTECDFRQQQVSIGEATLTGKIDRIQFLGDGQVKVHDLKTGQPHTSWKGRDASQTYDLQKYERQLYFYKVLVENSRDYGRKWHVESGQLDFLRSQGGEFVSLELGEFDDDKMERLKALISIIFQHVKDANFPDTGRYPADVKGSLMFEEDLLGGKI